MRVRPKDKPGRGKTTNVFCVKHNRGASESDATPEELHRRSKIEDLKTEDRPKRQRSVVEKCSRRRKASGREEDCSSVELRTQQVESDSPFGRG
jgi:hypothetical protein